MSPLMGRVVSVQFLGGFPAASGRSPILDPHWEEALAGSIADGDGSRRPAVYRIGDRVRATVEVVLSGAAGGGASGRLRGQLGPNLTLEGTIPLTNGLQKVTVSQPAGQNIGNAITRQAGDASWSIRPSSSAPVPLNITRLEVFAVLDRPASFFNQGVWVEALRLLVRPAGTPGGTVGASLEGVRTAPVVMRRITEYCHGRHGLSYDTSGTYNHFGVNQSGGSFHLSAFLEKLHRIGSCFDILGAVLVLAGAVGIPAAWLKVELFGFISQTNLIGIGSCNSPFFPLKNTGPIVKPRDPKRTRFEIHSFCGSSGRIFDACVGPHHTVTPGNYLFTAADPINHKKLPRPKVGDIMSINNPITSVF